MSNCLSFILSLALSPLSFLPKSQRLVDGINLAREVVPNDFFYDQAVLLVAYFIPLVQPSLTDTRGWAAGARGEMSKCVREKVDGHIGDIRSSRDSLRSSTYFINLEQTTIRE